MACWTSWLTASRRRLEGKQKSCEHRLGIPAHVKAVFEFREVLRQVFGRNVDVRSPDAVLEPRPEAFEGVDMRFAVHPFVG